MRMYIHRMNVYIQCMYMVHTGFNQLFQQETDDRLGRRQLWRKGACTELGLACVARLPVIGPDEKWSVVVELYSLRRVCTMYIHIYNHERVCTMYIHNFTFISMYVHTTYIYIYSCTCTYTCTGVVMYFYVHGINMSVPCSDTYVPFCPILSRCRRSIGTGFQMWACISVIRCCSLQYSAIGRAELQQRIQPQGSYPFWSLISNEHASCFSNSYIVFANEDSFAYSSFRHHQSNILQAP